MATFRLGDDWLALPTVEVASLHWRGLVADHRDPRTGLAYLRCERGLVPLLDALPLAGGRRRHAPEFVLVLRSGLVSGEPPLAGLLVDEFGEVLRFDASSAGPAASRSWWSAYQHQEHQGLLATRQGLVPILCAGRLVAAAPQWFTEGTSC